MLLLLTAATAGCAMEEQVISTSFGFEPKSEQPDRPESRGWLERLGGSAQEEDSGTWAIALGRTKGDDHHAQAQRLAQRLGEAADTDDVWIDDEGDGTMIYFGRYESRSDPTAQADLRRWREYNASGRMRLPLLVLSPVGADAGRSSDGDGDQADYSLETVASRGKYTYQVGVYDEDYGEDYQEAAEEAVRVLREDGWEAYYNHGPVYSTVSIGIFGDDALDEKKRTEEAQQVEMLSQKFPKNLLNGRTVRVKDPSGAYDQPTFLVEMPR